MFVRIRLTALNAVLLPLLLKLLLYTPESCYAIEFGIDSPAWKDVCSAEIDLLTVTRCYLDVANNTGTDGSALEWEGSSGNILEQPRDFYGSPEAARIADTVLAYQNQELGGWGKNYDRIAPLVSETAANAASIRSGTIDNGSTHTEIAFLARVYHEQKTPDRAYRTAVLSGLNFLLESQYPSGGWPQVYPLPNNYHRHITFNDDAMTDVLVLLYEIVKNRDNLYSFIDPCRRELAAIALQSGLDFVLDHQIVVSGQPTAWCAQYDAETLEPVQGRPYEPPSISGQESIAIVRFLMSLEQPTDAIIDAVENAMSWFERSQIRSLRKDCFWNSLDLQEIRYVAVEGDDNNDGNGAEGTVVFPLWARFNDLETGVIPLFQDRESQLQERFEDLPFNLKRYQYLTGLPSTLFCVEYPAWKLWLESQDTGEFSKLDAPADILAVQNGNCRSFFQKPAAGPSATSTEDESSVNNTARYFNSWKLCVLTIAIAARTMSL